MVIAAPLDVELEGTFNTRDLGGLPTAHGAPTRADCVWRSDAFTLATSADIRTLAERGVRTVIDLRTAFERAEEPHPLERDGRFEVVHVDLFAPVIAGFMEGTVEGDPFDLRTHYRASFRLARDGYREVFGHVSRALGAGRGPVVVHCTAGKDRTGLVSALLLRAAGVDESHILRDYARTAERIAPLRPRLIEEALAKGFTEEAYLPLLEARPETLRGVLLEVDDELAELAAEAAARWRTGGARRAR
jgi:protein-tyrosine phosphatase